MCTISKNIGVKKEISLPDKESKSGYKCERANMAARCELFVNCSKNFTDICKIKQIWLTNKEYLRDHEYERAKMAYKCKIFEAVNLILQGHYTDVCTVSKVIVINTENKICMSNKGFFGAH